MRLRFHRLLAVRLEYIRLDAQPSLAGVEAGCEPAPRNISIIRLAQQHNQKYLHICKPDGSGTCIAALIHGQVVEVGIESNLRLRKPEQ